MLYFSAPPNPSTDFGRTADAPAQKTHFPSFLPITCTFPQHSFCSTSRSFQRFELDLTPIWNPGGCLWCFRRVQERNNGPLRPARGGQVVPGVHVCLCFPLPLTTLSPVPQQAHGIGRPCVRIFTLYPLLFTPDPTRGRPSSKSRGMASSSPSHHPAVFRSPLDYPAWAAMQKRIFLR